MNLNDARAEALNLIEAGNAVMFRGSSGLGKSDMANAIFAGLKAQGETEGQTWGMGVIFAATQTPPDLIGYQFKGEREFTMPDGTTKTVTVTDPSVPLWMISTEGKPAWMYDRFFLFIDEYGQGEADVKRGLAEIFLKGGTAPWYLPPGSVRFAATNVGARYGVTKDFDFCIARRSVIDITGDAEVWLRWADKPYHYQGKEWLTQPVIKAWAQTHPEILFEPEPNEQGPWCNPRTLCSADRYLQVKAAKDNGTIPTDASTIETLAGTIGMPATQSLVNHLQFRLQLPSYDSIVADPHNAPVPDRADLLLLMAYEMAGYTKSEHLSQVITYVQRLPKDMTVTYISSLLRRDYKGLINEPAMQAWINKNASLVSIVASLSH